MTRAISSTAASSVVGGGVHPPGPVVERRAPVLDGRRRGPSDAFVDLGVGQRLERLLDLAGRRIRRRNGHEILYHRSGATALSGASVPRWTRERKPPSRAPSRSQPVRRRVEPIIESDDEIRAALADAEVPPLLPALAYLTGDLSLLRDDLRPDPLLLGDAPGRAHRRPARRGPRARARGADPVPRRRLPARAAAVGRRRSCRSWSSRSAAAPTWRRTSRCSKRSSRSAARTAARRAWRKADVAPDADFRVRDHRRRHVGPARRAPARAGRRRRS